VHAEGAEVGGTGVVLPGARRSAVGSLLRRGEGWSGGRGARWAGGPAGAPRGGPREGPFPTFLRGVGRLFSLRGVGAGPRGGGAEG